MLRWKILVTFVHSFFFFYPGVASSQSSNVRLSSDVDSEQFPYLELYDNNLFLACIPTRNQSSAILMSPLPVLPSKEKRMVAHSLVLSKPLKHKKVHGVWNFMMRTPTHLVTNQTVHKTVPMMFQQFDIRVS